MADHAPGPWTFDGPHHSIIVWDANGDRVCFMTSDGACKENARLIVAAPELLAAAQKLDDFAWSAVSADCEEAADYLMSLVTNLRSAVAKAEGRSND